MATIAFKLKCAKYNFKFQRFNN